MRQQYKNLVMYLLAASALTALILKEDYRTNDAIENSIVALHEEVVHLEAEVKRCTNGENQ